ncbi:hypothetical protein D3C85_612350 [compost metagenome]
MGLEACEGVGQQRGRGFVLDMQSAQDVFVHAADGQNLLQGFIGESIRRSAQASEHGTSIPFEWLVEFGLPTASAVVLHARLVSVSAGRVLQAMLASVRVLPDLIAFVIEPQQVLILMSEQALIAGLRVFRQSDRLFIGAEIRVPQSRLAADFHGLEPLDERRDLDRRDTGAGQHMCGAHERQLSEVDQHSVEIGRGLFFVALAPVLYAFRYLGKHLRDHDAEHGFTQTRHQHRGKIEHVPTDGQITGQAFEAGGRVLIIGRYGDEPGIGDGLVATLAKQRYPQITINTIGDGLGVRILHCRFTPPRAHVERFTLMPGERCEAFIDPRGKQRFVLLRDKTAEKGLIFRASQLTNQFLHEGGQRRIFLQGMVRIVRHVGNQRSGQTTLLVDVFPAQKLITKPLRPIGEKSLQQFESIVILPGQ